MGYTMGGGVGSFVKSRSYGNQKVMLFFTNKLFDCFINNVKNIRAATSSSEWTTLVRIGLPLYEHSKQPVECSILS